MRTLHSNGASLFFICFYFHILITDPINITKLWIIVWQRKLGLKFKWNVKGRHFEMIFKMRWYFSFRLSIQTCIKVLTLQNLIAFGCDRPKPYRKLNSHHFETEHSTLSTFIQMLNCISVHFLMFNLVNQSN